MKRKSRVFLEWMPWGDWFVGLSFSRNYVTGHGRLKEVHWFVHLWLLRFSVSLIISWRRL